MKKIPLIVLAVYVFLVVAAPAAVLPILCNRHIDYDTILSAGDFGLPDPDSLELCTSDGFCINTLKLTPKKASGAVICLTGIDGPTVTRFYGFAKEFYNSGLMVFLPELRGHGDSDGDEICLAYKESADVKAVTDYIVKHFGDLPIVVMGHSMGGATAINAISTNEDIDAAITISAFSSVQDVVFSQAKKYISVPLAAPLLLTCPLFLGMKFNVNAYKETPRNLVSGLSDRPLLMIHCKQDPAVPFYCFDRLYEKAVSASTNVQTLTTETGDHFVLNDFEHPWKEPEINKTILDFVNSAISRASACSYPK